LCNVRFRTSSLDLAAKRFVVVTSLTFVCGQQSTRGRLWPNHAF
jgi:hypothetical protein